MIDLTHNSEGARRRLTFFATIRHRLLQTMPGGSEDFSNWSAKRQLRLDAASAQWADEIGTRSPKSGKRPRTVEPKGGL